MTIFVFLPIIFSQIDEKGEVKGMEIKIGIKFLNRF